MNTVLDFGGTSRSAVFEAFRQVSSGRRLRVFVLPRANEAEYSYIRFEGTLDEALDSLVDGRNSSVQVEAVDGGLHVVTIYPPQFLGDPLQEWSGNVECSDNVIPMFDRLQKIDGLGYVALSKEDSPDFVTEHVTDVTFPWEDWRLKTGAVRGSDGKWVRRRKDGL